MTTSAQHLDGKLTLGALAGWRDAPQAGYYGLGMDSSQDDRANFDLERRIRARRRPRCGRAIGRCWRERSPSRATPSARAAAGSPSIEETYTPVTAPGLGTNPTYLHSQATAAIDWRTSPGYSRTGGYYGVTLHDYTNTNGAYDFNRLDGDADSARSDPARDLGPLVPRQAQTTLGDDDLVPYFLLPSLGSGSTLAGLPQLAFSRSAFAPDVRPSSAGFRAGSGMDMAVFYDAGKVASRREDLNFERPGARLGLRRAVPRARFKRRCASRWRTDRKAGTSSSPAPPLSDLLMRTEPSTRTRRAVVVFALAVAAVAASLVVRGAGPQFYRDDPLSREPETADAAKVAARDIDLIPDLLPEHVHQAGRSGAERPRA